MKEIIKLNIYCPSCKQKVGIYDGRATMRIDIKCKKCNKRVKFNPTTLKTDITDMPIRETASGKRFY